MACSRKLRLCFGASRACQVNWAESTYLWKFSAWAGSSTNSEAVNPISVQKPCKPTVCLSETETSCSPCAFTVLILFCRETNLSFYEDPHNMHQYLHSPPTVVGSPCYCQVSYNKVASGWYTNPGRNKWLFDFLLAFYSLSTWPLTPDLNNRHFPPHN